MYYNTIKLWDYTQTTLERSNGLGTQIGHCWRGTATNSVRAKEVI